MEQDQVKVKKTKLVKMNRTSDRIGYAAWTWNPVTGCKHGCEYCYARAVTERFPDMYPFGFKPTIHTNRMQAPSNTKLTMDMIKTRDPRFKNVLTCSMSDLFGDWLPKYVIQSILDIIEETPRFQFLLLTKNPKRLKEFRYPKNAWIGTSITGNELGSWLLVDNLKMIDGLRYISFEPLLRKIDPNLLNFDGIDWIIIGCKTKGAHIESIPLRWITRLLNIAEKYQIPVWVKENTRVKEYKELPKELCRKELPCL